MGIVQVSTKVSTQISRYQKRKSLPSRIKEVEERKALPDILRFDHGTVRQEQESENQARYVKTIYDEREIKNTLKKGDRISFMINKPWDGKGAYRSMTDSIVYLYRNFAYTCNGYCVRYRDITRKDRQMV